MITTMEVGRAANPPEVMPAPNISPEFLPDYRPLFSAPLIIPGAKSAKEWILKNDVALTHRPDSPILPAGTSVTLVESSLSDRLIRVRWHSHELCLSRSSIEPKQ